MGMAAFDVDHSSSDLGQLSLKEAAMALENLLVSYATGGPERDADYQALRDRLMSDADRRRSLPEFVRTSRNLRQFWSYIKKWETYQERREELWTAFGPFFESLSDEGHPVDTTAAEALATLDAEHVKAAWQKALDRRRTDPEGAITAARTMLESVCKLILDHYETSTQMTTYRSCTARSRRR
jgi:hypothetical protein